MAESSRYCHNGPMSKNRVREIRQAHGMTLEKLAEVAGLSHTHLSRIENGKRGLTIPMAEKLAKVMKTSVAEIIGANSVAAVAMGLAEDAAPYAPAQSEAATPVFRAQPGHNIDPWIVKTNVLDRAGIPQGSVVYVDISAEALEHLEPLQCVVAQVYDESDLTRAVTVLRQFVPPSLLITNSSGENHPSLDIDKGEAYIKGVIRGTFRPL